MPRMRGARSRYLGSFDADDIDSGNNRARIRNLNANPTINQGKDVADPWALKTSVFLHDHPRELLRQGEKPRRLAVGLEPVQLYRFGQAILVRDSQR